MSSPWVKELSLWVQTLSLQTEMPSPWVSMSSPQVETSSQVITYYVPYSWSYIIKWAIIIPGANKEQNIGQRYESTVQEKMCSYKNRPIYCMKTSWSRAELDEELLLKPGSDFRIERISAYLIFTGRPLQISLIKPCATFQKKRPPSREIRTENYRLQD